MQTVHDESLRWMNRAHTHQDMINAIRDSMPELPDARAARYQEQLGLSAYDAGRLSEDPDIADYFEAVQAASGEAKLSANWVLGELAAALNRDAISISASPLAPDALAALISRIADDTVSSTGAKTVFESLWQDTAADVDTIIDAQGLRQMNDSGALEAAVAEVINANPDQVEQFRQGKEKILGFLVGQVMKATQGKANPKQVNELLRSALK